MERDDDSTPTAPLDIDMVQGRNVEMNMHDCQSMRDSSVDLLDPICGMTVDERSPHRVDHAYRTHFFCSAGCRTVAVAPDRAALPSTSGAHESDCARE
jgi:Cu+-exporting ATPase